MFGLTYITAHQEFIFRYAMNASNIAQHNKFLNYKDPFYARVLIKVNISCMWNHIMNLKFY